MTLKAMKKIKAQRTARTRSNLSGTATRPRMSVVITNTQLIAQLIDDVAGTTLLYLSTTGKKTKLTKNIKSGTELGKSLAEAALAKGIKEVVFDRGSRRFHGRVKSIAEGARAAGLKF